jgi:hypothetical protein
VGQIMDPSVVLGRELTDRADDGWRVVEIWESQETLDRFFKDKLGAALQRANISVQPEVFQVQNIMTS